MQLRFFTKDPSPRIIEFDIETSRAVGTFFGPIYEANIIDVLRQSYMLSFAYKLMGEKKIHTYALPDFPLYKKDKHNDQQLVEKLAEVLSTADIIIGHNSDRFDLTTTNTRMLFHGLDPLPPTKTIDTCKEARRVLKLPSNKLDHIGEYYGIGRKLPHTGAHLWEACEADVYHPKEWKLMRDYNAQDVWLLDKVYLRLRPFIRHPNVNIYSRQTGACPKCGSKNIQQRGYHATRTTQSVRLSCNDCGAWSLAQPMKLDRTIQIR